MNSGLSFFKFISSSEKMNFPPESVARMQGILGDRVILRDVDEKLWSVEVERDGDGFSFKKGWPQFYQENSLEPGNAVVFTYTGGDMFNFILHRRNACDNKPVAAPTFRVKEEVEELVSEEEMDLNNDDEESSVDDDDDDDDDDEDYVEEEEEEEVCIYKNTSRSSCRCKCIHTFTKKKGVKSPIRRVEEEEDDEESTDSDEYDGIEMQMEEEDEEEEEATSIGKAEQKPRSSSSLGSKRPYKKQNVPDCYGHDIFNSGLAIRPKNPYFVSRSRKPRKNELYIPRDIIVDFSLKIPTRLFLVDSSGKKWETKMKKWRDGRLWCTRGWKSLCSVNNIGVDDTCICEFVQRGQDGLCMLVQLVDVAPRAGSGGSRNFSLRGHRRQ